MKTINPKEFKIEAVKQITERGHKVAEVSARIGVSQHSLYKWVKAYSAPPAERQAPVSQTEEMRRLKAELRRVIRGARHPKKGRRVLCQAVRVRYAFIKAHEAQHSVRGMCFCPAGASQRLLRLESPSHRVRGPKTISGWLACSGKHGWRAAACMGTAS